MKPFGLRHSHMLLVLVTLTSFATPAFSQTAGSMRLAMDDMMPMQAPSPGTMRNDDMRMPNSMQMAPRVDPGMGPNADHSQMMDMMRMRSMQPGMTAGSARLDLTDRIEGRIAFLRAELHITDAQSTAWNGMADALRSARKHLIDARLALDNTSPSARLAQYERHLSERLEALKGARAAFDHLFGVLDAAQKRVADELLVPFIATF